MNRTFYILFFTLLTFILGAFLLFPSVKYLWATDKYNVSIAVSKTPLSTPFYVARAINAFEDTCVNVEYNEVLGGLAAFARVMDGETDFATSSDSVIAFNSLAKKPFVNHAMFVQSDNDVKLMSRTLANIKSVTDLKGKRVGVTKGTASQYFLSTLLAIEGLTIEEVELRHYKPDQLLGAFNNNEVDAIVPWEPFAFQAAEALSDEVYIHDTKNVNTLSFNLISQNADNLLVEKAKCVLQGVNIAIEYIASNPEKSKNIVMNDLQLSPSLIDWVWDDYIFKLGLNQSLILNIKSQAAWAIEMHMSEYNEMPNIDSFLDSRAMLQVDPGAVNIPQ